MSLSSVDAAFSPPPESEYFFLTKYFHERQNPELADLALLSFQIENARTRLANLGLPPEATVEYYHRHTRPWLEMYTVRKLEDISHIPTERIDTCFRAQTHLALLDQHVLFPRLFSYPPSNIEARHERRKLIQRDGIYALVAGQIEQILDILPLLPDQTEPKQRLIGYLNELSAVALINKEQNANAAALPSLALEDWRYSKDITVWMYLKDTEQRTFLRHVKSDESSYGSTALLTGLIGGIALGNSTRSRAWNLPRGKREQFLTARAIVDETNGRGTQETHDTLRNIARHLIGAIRVDAPYAQLEYS